MTASITTGTVTTSDKGEIETATLAVSYSYAGTIIGINFAGTGARTYAGPRH